MFFGGSDPGYPKVDAPGWPRHPPPRWASSFPGVPCLHVYTHIPYTIIADDITDIPEKIYEIL